MLEFIGTCNGCSEGKNGKQYKTFYVSGIIGFISVAQEYSLGAESGRKYIIRCKPRKFEDQVFLTYSVVAEV